MVEEKCCSVERVGNKGSENLTVYSDMMLAARAGWLWIVLLTSLAIVLSMLWHNLRPQLFEAKATIRVGWVHDGISTVPVEPIEDLLVMIKQERFLKPLFEEIGNATQNETDEFVGGLSLKWSPKTNVVEIKNVSSSSERARVWLERLVFRKVAEHEKIINDLLAAREHLIVECLKVVGAENSSQPGEWLGRCLPQVTSAYPAPPLTVRTVISQPVSVEEAAVFPSLRFLIVASFVWGVVSGTFMSILLEKYKCFKQSDPVRSNI